MAGPPLFVHGNKAWDRAEAAAVPTTCKSRECFPAGTLFVLRQWKSCCFLDAVRMFQEGRSATARYCGKRKGIFFFAGIVHNKEVLAFFVEGGKE